MASHVWLGGLKPDQEKIPDITKRTEEFKWLELLTTYRGEGLQVIIAKGNIIEGIEAKE